MMTPKVALFFPAFFLTVVQALAGQQFPGAVVAAGAASRDSRSVTVLLRLNDGREAQLRIEVLSPFVARLRARADGQFGPTLPERDGLVKTDWPLTAFRMTESTGQLRVATEAIAVLLNRKPFALSVHQGDRQILSTPPNGLRLERQHAVLAVSSPRDERFLGFGDQGVGHDRAFPPDRATLDHRGRTLLMAGLGSNRVYFTPFFMSSRGYGLFLNTLVQSDWDMAKTKPDQYSVAVSEPSLDVYFIADPGFAQILERYTEIIGRPPMPPKWKLGLTAHPQLFGKKIDGRIMDSGMGVRWFDQDEAQGKAKTLRAKGLPYTTMLFDSAWQTVRNSFEWVPQIPNPARMIKNLNSLDFQVVLWQRPTLVKDDYSLFHEAERRGFLVKGPDGRPFISRKYGGPSGMVDFTNPEAVKWWKEKQAESIRLGARSFKLDSASSAFIESYPEALEVRFHNGMTGKDLDNYYGVLYLKTVWEGLKEELKGRRAVLHVYHSTYFAGGRFPFMALGDRTRQSTEDLKLLYAVNYGLSGVPFWEGGSYSSFGLPLAPTDLQMRLAPYTYSYWHEAHETGLPLIRAMALECPQDDEAYDAEYQFLYGKEFLVAPVLAGTRHWTPRFFVVADPETPRVGHEYVKGQVDWQRVYLPPGEWIHYWTGKRYRGPEWRYFRAVEGLQPTFVRAGAIIPTASGRGYPGQQPEDPLTLDIYPSGESQFTLYEDDGDTYAYESGAFATTEFLCRESAEGIQVIIGPTKGNYEGKPVDRSYILQIRGTTRPKTVKVDSRDVPQLMSGSDFEAVRNETLELAPLRPNSAETSQAPASKAGAAWFYRLESGHDRSTFVQLPRVKAEERITIDLPGGSVVRYYGN